ncbi:MAG: hypothetical protein KF693_16980 [Nitrospira sp.]|nr:hypothetical protein [Nitrospira sp.]
MVSAVQLIPGDLVSVEVGDVLPTDLRLVDAAKFKYVLFVRFRTGPLDEASDLLPYCISSWRRL